MSVINTNVMSLNAQRNLSTSGASLATSIQRLSSGLRINSAKDDAAGLAISERFTTQIRGMNQAARNANDGISLAQTAEGALGEIGNNLQRIRELAVQSRNATNSADDRAALQKEVSQLKSEIDRVADTTTFNGTKLLDGSFTAQAFQVGANQGETIDVASIADANIAALGTWTSKGTTTPAVAGSYTTGQIGNLDFSSTTAATAGSFTFNAAFSSTDFSTDSASFDVDGNTVTLDQSYADQDALMQAIQDQLDTAAAGTYSVSRDSSDVITISTVATGASATAPVVDGWDGDVDGGAGTVADLTTGQTGVDGAASTSNALSFSIGSTNVSVTSDYTGDQAGLVADIQGQLGSSYVVAAAGAAGFSVTAATAGASFDGTISSASSNISGGTTVAGADAATVAGSSQTGFATLDISTVDGADNAILAMDAALKSVNGARADLGAVQNRFESVISNLNTTSENLTASRSRIRDADYAKETAELSRTQILQQAGTAMLAQANQATQGVLSLLR